MAATGGGLFGAVQAQLDTLSPRDRRLLSLLFVFGGLLFVVFVAMTMRGRLNDKASRVVVQKESLEAVQDLRAEYVVAAAHIEQAEKRLEEYGDQPLSAFLERAATQLGASEELSVSRQQTETVGGIEQTRYKVDLRRVHYDVGMNFVYDIETSGYPLRIDSATFKKVRYKGEYMLSVTLELTTFALEESG